MRTLIAVALLALPLSAHDPGLSSAALRLQGRTARLELTFNGSDIAAVTGCDRDGNGRLDAGEVSAGRATLLAWARAGATLRCGDTETAATEQLDEAVSCDNGDVRIRLGFTLPAGEDDTAVLSVALLRQFGRSHRQYAAAFAGSDMLGEALLRPDQPVLSVAMTGGGSDPWGTARSFFGLGVEHILIGFDHLAFLLGLLLVAGSLRKVAVLITSFTVAHSLTLGLATFDLLRPPGAMVEAVIALSIVWIGVENLITRQPRRRWLTTFGFGLVHGFGFAGVLQELGIAQSAGTAVPLLSFNLGVEAGQLAVAALLLPMFWWCAKRPSLQRRLVPLLSLAVSTAGAFWLVERTLL